MHNTKETDPHNKQGKQTSNNKPAPKQIKINPDYTNQPTNQTKPAHKTHRRNIKNPSTTQNRTKYTQTLKSQSQPSKEAPQSQTPS